MADPEHRSSNYLHTEKSPVWWNWWRENPVEIILVVFILVLFFALPRAGCGVTTTSPAIPAADASGPASP